MIDFKKLHEIESVHLESQCLIDFSDLERCLRLHGFTQHEDVFSLDRTDNVRPWQHSSISEVHVFRGGIEVYDEEGWDAIRLDYLFASLPFCFVDSFVASAFDLGKCLNLSVYYDGSKMQKENLLKLFFGFADDLMRELYETPGSEELAILISLTYPR